MNELGIELVKDILSEFMKYNSYSPVTVERYGKELKKFNQFLITRYIYDYRDTEEKHFYEYRDYPLKRTKRGIKKESLAYSGSILKRIFAILFTEDKIIKNPFADVENYCMTRRVREMTLTEKEMENLLDSLDGDKILEQRDKTIFEVLYASGIRSGELINLEISDFLKEERMLFVRNGKGGKDRLIPLVPGVSDCLNRYLKTVRPKLAGRKSRSKSLFLTNKGMKIGKSTLNNVFIRAREKSGIDKQFGPHVIRHSFATHLLNAGADIREVQQLLGHEGIKSTEVYLNLTTARLKEVYEKYHPIENELFFDVYGREDYVTEWKVKKKA